MWLQKSRTRTIFFLNSRLEELAATEKRDRWSLRSHKWPTFQSTISQNTKTAFWSQEVPITYSASASFHSHATKMCRRSQKHHWRAKLDRPGNRHEVRHANLSSCHSHWSHIPQSLRQNPQKTPPINLSSDRQHLIKRAGQAEIACFPTQ